MDERLEKNVIIARSGVYIYGRDEIERMTGLSLGGVPDKYKDLQEFGIYTSALTLATAKDLFVKLPLTREHPPEAVTPDNFGQYAKGWSGDTSKVVPMDDSKEIGIESTCNLLDREALIYYECNVRDVSPGYFAEYEWNDGISPDGTPYQIVKKKITGVNHLAFTQKGRGGKGVAMDSLISRFDNEKYKITMDSIWEKESKKVMSNDSEFNEADHPRKDNGQFGKGSMVKSESGELKTVYHGTRSDLEEFEETKEYSNHPFLEGNEGLFFTDDFEEAEFYTEKEDYDGNERKGDNPHVKEVFLNIERPYEKTVNENATNYIDRRLESLLEKIEENDLDGIIIHGNTNTVYFVPNKEQVLINKIKKKVDATSDSLADLAYYSNRLTIDSTAPTFSEMVNDILENREKYDQDEIKTGVDTILKIVESMPDSEEKSVLTRIIKDLYDVKKITSQDSAKVACDLVTDSFEKLDKKVMEESMGLFNKTPKKLATDAEPEKLDEKPAEAQAPEAPAQSAPEAPAEAPAEQPEAPAPANAQAEAPAQAPITQAVMEVASMPDDVTGIDEATLLKVLNGLIKFAKSIAPGEAQEPQHQAPALDSEMPEGDGIPTVDGNLESNFNKGKAMGEKMAGDSDEEDKGIDIHEKKAPTTDSIFRQPIGGYSRETKQSLKDLTVKMFGKKGVK